MGKESFILYDNYATQINLLNDEQAGVLFKAIFAHRTGEALPKMDGATAMAFSFISSSMQADEERYEKICEKRRQAGSLGGAPLGNENAKNKQNKQKVEETSKTSKSPPDIDIDIDIDKSQKKEENKKKKENAQAQFFKDFPSIVFDNYDRNVLAELTAEDWLFIIQQFKKSDWLRKNVKTVSMLCKLSTRILAGQYAPFEKADGDGVTDEERAENIRRFEAMFGTTAGY